MATFADELAWLCSELGLIKPIVVGVPHQSGGQRFTTTGGGLEEVHSYYNNRG